MTTNQIERLDNALLRPGRVDLAIHFGRVGREILKDMFLAIYSTNETEYTENQSHNSHIVGAQASYNVNMPMERSVQNSSNLRRLYLQRKPEQEISVLAEKFSQLVPVDEFTLAEIQGYLLILY
jgi:mitochondrial chaperone BCS1